MQGNDDGTATIRGEYNIYVSKINEQQVQLNTLRVQRNTRLLGDEG